MKHTVLSLVLLLTALLVLAGCGSDAGSAPETSAPASSGEPSQAEPAPEVPDEPAEEVSAEGEAGWRSAYLAELNGLCIRYGKFVQDDPGSGISGVKYAHLADFDADGVRELVVLFDRTIRLYTFRDGAAEVLWEGEAGCRYGQTDVSYTFNLNLTGEQPCLAVYHSRLEWTQEAISLITVSGGAARVTELFAATDGDNEWPDRASLTSFSIDGESVSAEEYESVRGAALDNSLEIDVDWGADPVTEKHLDLLLLALSGEEEGDYVLPNSDTAYLTRADLEGLSAEELRLARNEIYARHGRTFSSEELNAYFTAQSWYCAVYTPEEFDLIAGKLLNRFEVANLELIRSLEDGGAGDEVTGCLTEEEARAIAAAYWDYPDGETVVDVTTGYLMGLVSFGMEPGSDGRSYYVFIYQWLVDNDHWSTLDWVYVDAETGGTFSELP